MKRVLSIVALSVLLVLLSGACSGPTTLPFAEDAAQTTPPPLPNTSDQTAAPTTAPATAVTPPSTATSTSFLPSTTAVPTTETPTTAVVTASVPTAPTTSPHPPGVLIVGDSILEGLNVLGYSFDPNTIYDTEVARSAVQLPVVIEGHEVPQQLVVHLGTNGWWPDAGAIFSEVFAGLSDRRIVLVNVSVDRSYTALANTELAAVAAEHDHVTLVDWNAAASPDVLRTDGYHPNFDGYDLLAQMIGDALGLPEAPRPTTTTTAEARPANSGQLVVPD